MPPLYLPKISPLWFRIWIVASIAWATAFAWSALPISVPAPSLDVVESLQQPSARDLRRHCTRYNQSVRVQMADGLHTLCFRTMAEQDVYFKWFSKASEQYTQGARRSEIEKQTIRVLGGFVIFGIILLATEWILRASGKGFLFVDRSETEKLTERRSYLSTLDFTAFQDAAPICLVVSMLWLALPLIAPWSLLRKGLDGFGPEAAGSFFLSGIIVLIYRKTLHPLVTIGALLIYIPPAALLLYLPLHANGLDLLLVPFGIGCAEFSRYLGSKLRQLNSRFSTFGWQVLIFISSYFISLLIFGAIIYI